jgi:choline kinase/quercetin dioxygenase-like cupin family protein
MISDNFNFGDLENNKYINNTKIVEKPWGKEIWLELNDKYCYKRIEIKAGFKTSYQYHNFKLETNYIIKGNAEVWLENDNGVVEKYYMKDGDFFTVVPPKKHRVIAITDVILQEVSTPEVDDVVRINDEFNRTDGKVEEEHKIPVVCIIAAGTGSRLGEISKNCHKTLLPYDEKAILSHIIDKFSLNVQIVIAVGYLKEQIIEYVNYYHSDRNIKFVDVDNYEGKGSGPAYSLECCRSFLQRPFYFCVSDFFTEDNLQNELLKTENWMGISSTETPEIYSTVDIENGKIKKLINKSKHGFLNAFTGLFYMYDYNLFWESFDKHVDENKEIIDVFKDIESFNFNIKNLDWKDTGTLELYNSFIEKYERKNLYLHNTKREHKYKKNKIFIKKMEPENKIINIVKRSEYLKHHVPKILNSGKYFLSYEYVEGNTLYNLNDKDKYIDFLKWFENNFCSNKTLSKKDYAFEFYKIKTETRLELIKKLDGFLLFDNITFINGKSVLPIEEYLNKINWEELTNIIETPLFHGDLQFDNVVATPDGDFTPLNNSIRTADEFSTKLPVTGLNIATQRGADSNLHRYKMIDWREDFGGNVTNGDLYYDLAKLYGGMEINYSAMKDSNNYNTSILNNEANVTQYNDNILKDIQKNEFSLFLERNNFDKSRVKLLTAIIFLNMSPLHINNFDIFLFFKSKLLFAEYFEEKNI